MEMLVLGSVVLNIALLAVMSFMSFKKFVPASGLLSDLADAKASVKKAEEAIEEAKLVLQAELDALNNI